VILAVLCGLVAVAALWLSTRMALLAKPFGLAPAVAGELGDHLVPLAALLLAFAVLGGLARFRRNDGLYFVVFALFPPLLFGLNVGAIEVVFNTKSARQLAQTMPVLPAQTEVVCLECFPDGLPFYLQRTATLVTTDGHELTSNYILYRLRQDPRWPASLVPVAAAGPWLSARTHPVYLLAHASDRPQMESLAGIQKTNVQQLASSYLGVLLPAP